MAERIFALSGAEAGVTRLPLFIYRAQMAACGFWILLSSVQIRREYRRAIMRYRGDVPRRSETPSQIEDAAQFPQDFDIAGLYEKYEKASYGESG